MLLRLSLMFALASAHRNATRKRYVEWNDDGAWWVLLVLFGVLPMLLWCAVSDWGEQCRSCRARVSRGEARVRRGGVSRGAARGGASEHRLTLLTVMRGAAARESAARESPRWQTRPDGVEFWDEQGDHSVIRQCGGKVQWWGAPGAQMECLGADVKELVWDGEELSSPQATLKAPLRGMDPAFFAALAECARVWGVQLVLASEHSEHSSEHNSEHSESAKNTRPAAPAGKTKATSRPCGCTPSLRPGAREFTYRR